VLLWKNISPDCINYIDVNLWRITIIIISVKVYLIILFFTASNFVLGNAESLRGFPIVYCSDGFCQLTGYNRYDVIGKSCNCTFLYSMETSHQVIEKINESLKNEKELKTRVDFSKKDGKRNKYSVHMHNMYKSRLFSLVLSFRAR